MYLLIQLQNNNWFPRNNKNNNFNLTQINSGA